MAKRFVSLWFRSLKTDWFSKRRPALAAMPFVLAAPHHGRMIVMAANPLAYAQGIDAGMAVADARAIFPALEVIDDRPELAAKLLKGIAEWCIRYTPAVAMDANDGLILDASGCSHLWGGDEAYITDMSKRLKNFGYDTRAAMADTIGAAWAMARFSAGSIIEPGQQTAALLPLPAAALRLEAATAERLEKLGLRQVKQFVNIPRAALRRRFGEAILLRLQQALGQEEEFIIPLHKPEPFQERLPCMEPIVTLKGIEIALERLLDALCKRLQQEGKGLRTAVLKCYRVDGKILSVETGTNRASCKSTHIFKLFETKLGSIQPDLGIELFVLEAPKTEDLSPAQEALWENTGGLENTALAELLDRLEGKLGADIIHRYLPAEHYWPERSFKTATELSEKPATPWRAGRQRPLQLLHKPELIEVTAPIPDYPPMLFRYKGKLHKIAKADGPERIEQEWWIQDGRHRDYYCVEDEAGKRYWLFRSGHYDAEKTYKWFVHGFFS